MSSSDWSTIHDWLIGGAQSAPDEAALLEQMCQRLVAAGLPLWRVGGFLIALHPHVPGTALYWTEGAPVREIAAPHDYFNTPHSMNSPYRHVVDSRAAIRAKLAEGDARPHFPVFDELRQEGATDYFAAPIFFQDGGVHCFTFSTRAPGGFMEAHIAAMKALMPPLARVLEILTLRRVAGTLLDTYVGSHAGARILAGHIRRGQMMPIDAVIWLSDMRGFTRLSEQMPPQALIDLLNAYFDCQAHAIERHDGEILKFMGDGLLAVFPVQANRQQTACLAAIEAAREAITAMKSRVSETEEIKFGIGLHVGQVLFGNIGGGRRLDFTAIGPAVNLAARIEKLAAQIGRPVLMTEEFARAAEATDAPVGMFELPGLASAQPVYALP